jgi:hypothetical protein
MKLGSREHKAQMCEELIKTYYENIWKDEMYLIQLDQVLGDKRKEFKNKNEGEKARFVAGQELKHIENEIKAITEKVAKVWPARIELVKEYLDKK